METGEIKVLSLINKELKQQNKKTKFLDAKKILSREQVDAAKIPILFVQLQSGQNGTLTPYPGQGIGKTWLSADGATITLKDGVLIASRGMGDDVMGGKTSMPSWSKIDDSNSFTRSSKYLSGNNQIYAKKFNCHVKKIANRRNINVWGVNFETKFFEEKCSSDEKNIINTYNIDSSGIVRRSRQYHSDTLGYIIIERIDR